MLNEIKKMFLDDGKEKIVQLEEQILILENLILIIVMKKLMKFLTSFSIEQHLHVLKIMIKPLTLFQQISITDIPRCLYDSAC